ncbi:MAG: TolC family protein [Treponema sp.]|jgi:outer membrane protein TolC|nr:TolC family protein [Treponema sp.]
MKTKIAFFLFTLISINAWAEILLDIDSAVSRALQNNLSLERSRVDMAATQRRNNNSWNSLIPSLSAGALLSHPTSITGSLPPQQEVWTPGFSLSASLSLSPAIFANINQTRQEYEAGLISYANARQELEFQVRRLYYHTLLLKANVDLAELNLAGAQSRHEQTLALQLAGRASNLDELSARLDVQNQQTNVQNAHAIYENAIDNLKYLLMIPMETTVILQGNLWHYSIGDHTAYNFGFSESMQMASLRQSIAVIEAQQRAAQLRSYAPTLNLSWNSTTLYRDQMGVMDWRDTNGQFSISLNFRLDNYLPWSASRESINSFNDAITKQQSLLTEAAINHQNTIQKLLRDIARSEETQESLRLNIILAEETVRMFEEAYLRGAVDLQALNNTMDNLRTAQNRLLSEQFNLLSIVLELERELNIPFGSIAHE